MLSCLAALSREQIGCRSVMQGVIEETFWKIHKICCYCEYPLSEVAGHQTICCNKKIPVSCYCMLPTHGSLPIDIDSVVTSTVHFRKFWEIKFSNIQRTFPWLYIVIFVIKRLVLPSQFSTCSDPRKVIMSLGLECWSALEIQQKGLYWCSCDNNWKLKLLHGPSLQDLQRPLHASKVRT